MNETKDRKTSEKEALVRITKSRMSLVLKEPFFGSLALRLRPTVAWWMPTAAVDGKHLFYNPAFIGTLNDAMLKGLVCHEVLHCANGHAWRRNGRDRQLWNIACDFAINPICINAKFELPPDGCHDDRFRNQPAEQIYATLRDEKHQKSQCQQPKPGGGQDQPQPGGAGGQPQPGEDNDIQSHAGSPDFNQDSDQHADDVAEKHDVNQEDVEPRDPRAPNYKPTFGEVMDAPAETAAQDEGSWRVAVVQALEKAREMGKMPAGLERLVTEFVEPKIDWRSVLRRFVQSLAADDYNWSHRNRRYGGTYLPGLRSETMPPIIIGVDTSGSIGREELAAFTAEISAIIGEMKPEITYVVYCDAEIPEDGVQEFLPGDPLIFKPAGGGGTSFVPVFKWVEEQGHEPACLIYLTDCYGTYPEEPGYPVLWASSTKEPGTYAPTFGEFLYIGDAA